MAVDLATLGVRGGRLAEVPNGSGGVLAVPVGRRLLQPAADEAEVTEDRDAIAADDRRAALDPDDLAARTGPSSELPR